VSDSRTSDVDVAAALSPIVAAIEAEFRKAPPTLAVIGLSGVGKSSVINAMFGTRRHVSATTRGTGRFSTSLFELVSRRVEGAPVACALQVIDAPGLGEDVALDGNYLERYRTHLPKADVALWIVAARNRALALDQQYLERLKSVMPNLVIGIGQVDLVDPISWSEALNMPSPEQEANIKDIVADRRAKLTDVVGREAVPAVAFSALRYYNLQALFNACLQSAPKHRRWMFELLKSFSTHDWLSRAKGLTPEQRKRLADRHINSDTKLKLDQLRDKRF
jgi:uncharacterized protein